MDRGGGNSVYLWRNNLKVSHRGSHRVHSVPLWNKINCRTLQRLYSQTEKKKSSIKKKKKRKNAPQKVNRRDILYKKDSSEKKDIKVFCSARFSKIQMNKL